MNIKYWKCIDILAMSNWDAIDILLWFYKSMSDSFLNRNQSTWLLRYSYECNLPYLINLTEIAQISKVR